MPQPFTVLEDTYLGTFDKWFTTNYFPHQHTKKMYAFHTNFQQFFPHGGGESKIFLKWGHVINHPLLNSHPIRNCQGNETSSCYLF